MFGKMLFPIDNSREVLRSVDKVLDIFKRHNSHLTVLSVVQSDLADLKVDNSFFSLLEQVRARILRAGIEFEVVEREGKQVLVICDVANELNIDVIVMRTRDVNLEEDSAKTASSVIQMAPCPVLVVP